MSSELTILGGGITGLVSAYLAAKSGLKVNVVEASDRMGGLLGTFPVGGNHLEYYYHHFFTHDAEIHWIIRELGIQDRLVYKPTSMGVFRNGKIYSFDAPKDLLVFKPMRLREKIRFGLTSYYLGKLADWKRYESITCAEWFEKYAGKNVTNCLWRPLLEIKFGPYAKEVPLAWMIGRLRQRMNSRKGSEEQLGYLDGSLKVLCESLTGKLHSLGVQLHCNQPVEEITVKEERILQVVTKDHIFSSGNFLSTMPTNVLARLIPSTNLGKQLASIEYFGAICVILELNKPFSEIYWLNIADPGFMFGGIIEHTNFIGPQSYNGKHILYLSRYFAHSESIKDWSNDQIIEAMLPQLSKINRKFDESWIQKVHVFRTNTAATVCGKEFSKIVPNCDTSIRNLHLTSMCHVYPDERSVNNSIRVAANAAKKLGFKAAYEVPYGSSLAGMIGM